MAGLQAGTLTAGSFTTMVDKLRYNPMQFQVHTFDTESAMQVWRVASPVERGQLTPIVVTKIVNSKTLSLEQKVGYLREIAGKR
jgi:hypothetical protein